MPDKLYALDPTECALASELPCPRRGARVSAWRTTGKHVQMSVAEAELFRDGELIRHFGCHVCVGRQFGERECREHPSSGERIQLNVDDVEHVTRGFDKQALRREVLGRPGNDGPVGESAERVVAGRSEGAGT